MKLSILIATLGRRETRFKSLVKDLNTQIKQFNDEIEIVAYWNNGELSIGGIRQELINQAKGEYVCFIDDDDTVPTYYCEQIMCNLGKDYVGFKVKLLNNGKEMPPVFHSLEHKNWRTDYDGYYRDITHLNPIRRSIALQGVFTRTGASEDVNWANSIRDLVKTENYIDEVMYIYNHDSSDTSFGTVTREDNKRYYRPEIKYKYFRYITKEGE